MGILTEENLLKLIKYKLNKNNLNDNFDKQLFLALENLKKISYEGYLKDLIFTYKYVIYLHKLTLFINKIAIFSDTPMYIDNNFTIFYRKFYKIYMYNIEYIKKIFNIYKYDKIKYSLYNEDVSFLIRGGKNKGKLLLDFGLVRTHIEGEYINNCDDYEGGFYLNFIYGSNDDELNNNIKHNNYYYTLGFYIGKDEIFITSIHKKKGFYIPVSISISISKFFMFFLSRFNISIIGLGNNLAFSRNEKGYGGNYDNLYNKYGFKNNNSIFEHYNLQKYLKEKKYSLNRKNMILINNIFEKIYN